MRRPCAIAAAVALVVPSQPALADIDTSLTNAEVRRIVDEICAVQNSRARQVVTKMGYPWPQFSAAGEQMLRENRSSAELLGMLREGEAGVAGGKPGQTEVSELQICLLDNKIAFAEQKDRNRKSAGSNAAQPGAGTGQSSGTTGTNVAGAPAAIGDMKDAAANFAKCITTTPYPRDGGIQQIWAMTNKCNTTVIVRYCFAANVEAAGDPNLCTRREYRTHEIRAGGKTDFPFTLVEKGQAMSDGTIAGGNSLYVSGFACTGGSFPNVYFDEGKFLSRGC